MEKDQQKHKQKTKEMSTFETKTKNMRRNTNGRDQQKHKGRSVENRNTN